MRVIKFGGSSVSTPERIKNAIDITLKIKKQHAQLAVVISAFGGVTDEVLATLKQASL
jgi:aspartokinase